VNYAGIAGSAEFTKYKRLTQELVRVQVENATREEKMAFFINIYNALVIHANIVKGPPGNMWQRYKVYVVEINCKWIHLYYNKLRTTKPFFLES
jgi:hypothetical protein